MKKLSARAKALSAILFALLVTNICCANLAPGHSYPSLPEIDPMPVMIVLAAISAILILGLIISLVCMISAKIKKSEQLLKKSKSVCENLLYYTLFVIALCPVVFLLLSVFPALLTPLGFVLGLLVLQPLGVVIVSLILRLTKDKKDSYILLGIIYAILIILLLIGFINYLRW